MWLSKRPSLKRQIKHIEAELKALRRERSQVEARGCYSDKELMAKEAQLGDYDRRIRSLTLEHSRLQTLYHTGGDRELS